MTRRVKVPRSDLLELVEAIEEATGALTWRLPYAEPRFERLAIAAIAVNRLLDREPKALVTGRTGRTAP